ncbi:Protein MAIN-LIKE 2 [Senna tora]|uniref:Protein MAIN-LIKE 2 n=1 Tax=Senna tora TaxID=362788 RepID=A0A834TR62_9FABA|nr:Protein MAIN-LIKE 2 [Senna tora]
MRKSTRRSLLPPPQLQDPVRTFSTRFSVKSYVRRVERLTNEQRSAVTRLGFGSVLLVPNHLLTKNLLAELMDRWDCEKQTFVLHLGEISITLLDVALILGLRVVGNPVLLKEDEPFSELEEEYGATVSKRKVTIASLESRLDSLGDSVCDDFIRAFLLYTMGTFLFPNPNGKVDSRYLSFLRNLDNVCQFAWGAAVIEDLSQWLVKRKENNVQYMGGCLMLLQTWSYEHFDIGRPGLQDHNVTFPRICRWDNSKFHQRHWFTSRFKDLHDDQVIWTLQPTSQELEVDIIKKAMKLQGDSKELPSAQSCSTSTSINSNELHRVHEINFENQVVEDTPTKLNTCEVNIEEVNLENLIVEETPTKSISGEVCCEQEVNLDKLIVEETPTESICDEVCSEKEVNLDKLIVEETPTESICDEVCSEKEVNLDKLIVEETPTQSICDEVCSEKEVNLDKLQVEDSPTESIFDEDDLRKRLFAISEEENVDLKDKVSQLMEENSVLRRQVLSNSQYEAQNAELKKELDMLREENRGLRHLINYHVNQLDRHILFAETNEAE